MAWKKTWHKIKLGEKARYKIESQIILIYEKIKSEKKIPDGCLWLVRLWVFFLYIFFINLQTMNIFFIDHQKKKIEKLKTNAEIEAQDTSSCDKAASSQY